MPLSVGSAIAHYQVTALIGEGGMGQVYQATDTKLNRQVALKILPQTFAADPDRLARFQREAQVLASLNHPGIAAIYGIEEADDTPALVLELVEGPTLADRIAQGPIPVQEALPMATQIAEALEAAHEQGIIHRDLKPANIKLRPDGTVKVLDFGLAKALDTAPEGDPSHSPTLTAAATQMGVIMGTAAYMAPEQASGKPVDKRADVWAFGVVLYEMLTGERAFRADDVSITLARVLDREPEWDVFDADIPPGLLVFIKRCLVKDPKERIRDIGDVRLAMTGAFDLPVPPPVETAAVGPAPRLRIWQRPVPLALGALGLAAAVAGVAWTLKPVPPQPVTRLSVSVPPSVPLVVDPNSVEVAVSPDGSRLVYMAGNDGPLYLREIGQIEAVPLRGAEIASNPFFSPDGQWVGFEAGTNGSLQKVSVFGGPPVTICELPANLRGASWGDDDVIVFATQGEGGLMRVSAAGGEPEVIAELSAERYRSPDVLPGAVGVLVTLDRGAGLGSEDVGLLDPETGEHEVLIPGGTNPRYSPTGHIVYGVEGTLRAVAFDLNALEVTSDPVPVVEGVLMKANSMASFDLSDSGSLVYVSGTAANAEARPTYTLTWVDREGEEDPLPLPPDAYTHPRLSPDGGRLAIRVADGNQQALWVYDVTTGRGLRLTHEGAVSTPVWTPDSARVLFNWTVSDAAGMYWVPADGSEPVQSLLPRDDALAGDFPTAVTPDGSALIFSRSFGGGHQEVWELPLDGDGAPTPLIQGEFSRGNAETTPDGNWLAYRSQESGENEVYLQPYPGPGGRVPVSIRGGRDLLISAAGEELFFRVGPAVMAVDLDTDEDTVQVGTPTELFRGDYLLNTPGSLVRQYGVTPDGRFLMLRLGMPVSIQREAHAWTLPSGPGISSTRGAFWG